MALITLLHWNIYQFSNNKLNNKNGAALINYIAEVAFQCQANIISLLELKNSAVTNIVTRLLPAINLKNGEGPPAENPWTGVRVDSLKNNEAYVVLYKTNAGFQPITATIGGGVINGLTNEKLGILGVPTGSLPFNSSLTTNGGRRPFYVAFRTTGSKPKTFSIIAYHTMFGVHSPLGVRNVGLLAQSRAILNSGTLVNMDYSLTSGDFNVDFDPMEPDAYDNLLEQVPSSQSTNEKTSLLNFTPPDGFPDSKDYRKNAYDNIFKYRRTSKPDPGGGKVVDLIYESTKLPKGNALMAPETENFKASSIVDGELIQHIPPKDFEDAWHIVRHAVSDHLPVFLRYEIDDK